MSFRNLVASIFPSFAVPFADSTETPGELQVSQSVAITETEPLEQPIIFGPIFPSKTAERRIVELACGLKRGIIKGKRGTLTFHFRDGSHIDVTVSKPYLLRKYRGGCIVQVEAP